MLKNKVLLFLSSLFLCASAKAFTQELNQESLDTPVKVGAVNDNLRRLYTSKLDLYPRGILPFVDSRYSLGESGREWLNLFVDTVTASSGTFTALTATTASFGSLTSTTGSFGSVTSTTETVTSSFSVTSGEVFNAALNYTGRAPLVYISSRSIIIANNTGTANQSCDIFPDGDYRCVTESTATASQFRKAISTETASLSGTWNSGMRSGETISNGNSLAVYAVKTTDNLSNMVLVFTTATPVQANVASLNSYFGTNGWVFHGMVFNGDNSGTTDGFLSFKQSGNLTMFNNTCTGATFNQAGRRIASTASAATLTYTYAVGFTTTSIPDNINIVIFGTGIGSTAGIVQILDSSSSRNYAAGVDTSGSIFQVTALASEGLAAATTGATAKSIFLSGFYDSALGVGPNPLF